jgi:Response regulator containing CheY-like receiver, AAA-type ATPase, and DNA-binding domains
VAPPLRERREDIPLLANYFVAKYVEKTGRKIAGISPQARAYLTRYDWPGNVRELENTIERAVVLGSSELIEPEDLPESVLESVSGGEVAAGGYHEGLIEAKKRLILGAIEQAGGSQLGAAKLLGVNPTYLSRLIRNLNLKYAAKPAGQR